MKGTLCVSAFLQLEAASKVEGVIYNGKYVYRAISLNRGDERITQNVAGLVHD